MNFENRKIKFSFEDENYEVGMEAYNTNKILLPDGRVLEVSGWLESYPPHAMGLFVKIGATADNFTIPATLKEQTLEEMNAKWQKNLFNPELDHNAKDLIKTVKPLMAVLMKHGTQAINLENLMPEKVNGMHLAVILRSTAEKRNEVKGWAEALEVARQALTSQKIDPNEALIGLL